MLRTYLPLALLLATPALPQSGSLTTGMNGAMSEGNVAYFDMVALQPLTVTALEVHLESGHPGASIQVWRRQGTALNFEGSPTGWTLAATGTIPSPSPQGTYSGVVLSQDVALDAGRTGFMVEYLGDEPRYGDGLFPLGRLSASNADLEIYEGSVGTAPFNGRCCAPRAWEGTVFYDLGASPPVGTSYCLGAPNSTGAGATIEGAGSALLAENDLALTASGLPVGSFTLFLTSQSQGFVTAPGGSQGILCLGGEIGRYVGPGQIQQASSGGDATLSLDLTALPQPTGSVSAVAGQTWNFQAWYRDAVNGVTTSNFTDGLAVSFQ